MTDTIVRFYISDDMTKGRIIHLAPDDPLQLAIEDYKPFVIPKDHKWFRRFYRDLVKDGSLEVWELRPIAGRTMLEPIRERFYSIEFNKEKICGTWLMENQERHESMEEAAATARESYDRLRTMHWVSEE